jgi:phosphatidylinositol dimannoside acyltransferase
MNDAVAEAVYATGWSVVQRMPEWLARRQFDAIADGVWFRGGPSVQRLKVNLDRVVPGCSARELNLLARDGVRSYLRYWCEVFQLSAMTTEEVIARIDVEGDAKLRKLIAAGDGVVISLPHTGNWDQAGAWLAGTGVPFTTVAERLKPEALFERFVAFRESLGMEVIPLTGGTQPPFGILAERLRSSGVLCLLADRDLTTSGIEVDFFGSPARMPAGPAALAHDTGAALVPVTPWYPSSKRWGLTIHDAVPVPKGGDRAEKVRIMTQQVADRFAVAIKSHPQDWHMLQRVWSADLDPSRLKV